MDRRRPRLHFAITKSSADRVSALPLIFFGSTMSVATIRIAQNDHQFEFDLLCRKPRPFESARSGCSVSTYELYVPCDAWNFPRTVSKVVPSLSEKSV